MKIRTFGAALLLTVGAGVVQAEDNPMAPVFGKQLVSERGTIFVYHEDGSITGLLGGTQTVRGKYRVTDTGYCAAFIEPAALTDVYEFCNTPKIEGDTFTFVRADGSESAPYMIK